MVNIEGILNKAIEIAKISKGVGRNKNYRLGAVLFYRGIIVTSKPNSYKTHPFCLKYSLYPHLHAEMHCILGAGLEHTDGCDILVTRLTRDGRVTMAMPCQACVKALRFAGINNAWYTNWKGELECLKVSY